MKTNRHIILYPCQGTHIIYTFIHSFRHKYSLTFLSYLFQSKGGILAKACDYIQELRTANQRMAESLKETERISIDNELLRQQCEELKQENHLLRTQLQQHGIVPQDLAGNPT